MKKEVQEVTKQFNFMTTLLAVAFIVMVVSFMVSFKRLAKQEPMMKSNEIVSSSDLNKATEELDGANLDEMDEDLEQLNSDSTSL